MKKAIKARKKRKKFREISIKISANQFQSIQKYCALRKTTINKLLKKGIAKFMNGFDVRESDAVYISPRQLDLFQEDAETYHSEQNQQIS